MRTVPALVLLVLATVGVSTPADAQRGGERRTIVAAALRDWPPHYSVEHGQPRGFAIDVMNEAAQRAGVRVRYRLYESFTQAAEALRHREVDVIPNFGMLPERESYALFTEPTETASVSIFVRHGTPDVVGLADLVGRDVAVVEVNVGARLLRGRDDIAVRSYPDVRSAFYDLLAGRVDALVYPRPVIEMMAREAGLADRIRVAGEPVAEVKRAIGVRSDDPELHRRLSEGVHALRASPEYEALYREHYGAPESFWTPARVAWSAAGLIALLAILFASWRARTLVRLNRELRERDLAERRYRTLMEQAIDGIFVADEAARFVDVNTRGCHMLGRSREELLGTALADVVDVAPVGLPGLRPGETLLLERLLRRKDGSTFPAEISAGRLPDGTLQAIVRDVSQRKRQEAAIREQEEMLRRSQKTEAIGRLAGGVAHDFNNMLTAVIGYSSMLLERPSRREEDVTEGLREIRAAAERGAALARQLLTLGRRQVVKRERLRIDDVVGDLRGILGRVIGEDVELSTVLEAGAAWVLADRGQLEQVLMNLVVNARDAMPEGGRLFVRTTTAEVGPDQAAGRPAVSPGPHVVLEVSDTGLGMDAETMQHLFEPFFTTKDRDRGTGLGLSIVLGIVEQSGGFVDVESRVHGGTTFRVHLPMATVAAAQTSHAVSAGAPPR